LHEYNPHESTRSREQEEKKRRTSTEIRDPNWPIEEKKPRLPNYQEERCDRLEQEKTQTQKESKKQNLNKPTLTKKRKKTHPETSTPLEEK